jgi:hypothetical protein
MALMPVLSLEPSAVRVLTGPVMEAAAGQT